MTYYHDYNVWDIFVMMIMVLIVDTIIIFPSHLVKSDVICDIPPLRGDGWW